MREWDFRFVFDESTGIVDASFRNVVLETPADAEKWEARVRATLKGYGRKVDLLIGLHGLRVRPKANRRFGELRAKLLEEFALCSFRYGGDDWTKMSINTSSVLLAADGNLFGTKEEALKALLAHRQERRSKN